MFVQFKMYLASIHRNFMGSNSNTPESIWCVDLGLLKACGRFSTIAFGSIARMPVSARYRLRSLEEFRYTEDNKDKGAGIRDRAKGILELMNDHETASMYAHTTKVAPDTIICVDIIQNPLDTCAHHWKHP